ncbi:phage tail tube protein [Limibaculum sp. FT325]|uniref:phage tail tube protein n=1 Tax=Thermohalobaculum sediminis TaxID=2939436 RepID=UPI0020C077AF|nr:phage tail tube protein [Limibaculum sediminis]MCL5779186.1 phage tail tube protein [Limibaculum sediminis]
MARAQGARAQMALAFETTYGTPPASGFWRMPFAQANLGAEQPLLASELLGYGRDPVAPIGDAITSDGDVTVPIDARFWGVWLKGAFGAPTTTGTGPYSHEFRSGGWTLPSIAIEIGMPEVPHYAMNAGCVVNQISWTMQRAGLITATVGLIGQGETIGTASSAGTLAALDLARFGAFHGTIRRAGVPLGNVVSAQITYANNLDRIETIRADGMIDGADPSLAALTGTIEVRFADHVLLDQALAGEPAELEFGFTAGPDLAFTLTAHAVYLPTPRLALQGPGGVQASFAWQAAQDAGLGRMATVTLVNDLPTYDNPVI